MQFSTPVPIQEGNPMIDYNSRILSLGSCFAVNIGQKFDYFKFQNTINPFGILFHPLAIEKTIRFAIENKSFTEGDIFFQTDRWNHYDAHSDLSATSETELLHNLNNAAQSLHKVLTTATHITITLGTSWVYRLTATGELVANCHKVPQKQFTKELLDVNTISNSIQNILSLIAGVNDTVTVIFTVSPVRHIKDGFMENQWSKANLISALHATLQAPLSGIRGLYFPSYEIMMDELRDYRFYAEDMIHPNPVAIDYIWERFAQNWISDEAQQTMKQADNIQKSLQHRPFNPESDSHKKFLENLGTKIAILEQQHPHIKF
ncbi:GSCFA domain-containing protein [Flavobacterium sp. RHBU_3]|uniref:GSCFA domain-containing protein n=1 Tax=Flavobacterium sp. RHBU_3 TaxID=3391184 RepID=UPI0039853D83